MKNVLGLYTAIPKTDRGQFRPPSKAAELQELFKNAQNGVIFVPSKGSDIRYIFRGVTSLDELVTALTYVMKLDYWSGAPTHNAKLGRVVYNHSEYEKAKRSLAKGLERTSNYKKGDKDAHA